DEISSFTENCVPAPVASAVFHFVRIMPVLAKIPVRFDVVIF
ncbi:MAG: hypothetical protein ACI8P0_004144, partial [Planctomycetaceae bacterium]